MTNLGWKMGAGVLVITQLLSAMPLQAAIRDAAVSDLERPVQERPAIAGIDELIAEGLTHNAAGRYEDAARVFRQAAAQAPDNAFVLFNLGTVLGMLKRYQEAAVYLKEAVRLSPDLQPAWANLGAMYNHLGDATAALAAYRQVLRLNPQDANAHLQSGLNLIRLGKIAEASLEEEELRSINPEMADQLLQQIMAAGAQ